MFWSTKSASVVTESDPAVRRSHLSPDKLVTRPAGDEVTVVGDFFSYCARKYRDRTACYYRDVVDIVEEEKVVPKSDGSGEEQKVWKYFNLSAPKAVSYTELDDTCTALTSGLVHIGFTDPSIPVASRPRVSIYADTSLHWQLMSQAFARLGHVITTAYTTLGQEGLVTSLVEPDVELCFCGGNQLSLIAEVIHRTERVRYVIYDGGNRADQIRKVVESRNGQITTYEELSERGRASLVTDLGPKPTEDDLFCIMYTSGSTGPPKGVLLTHKNVIASIAGSTKLWGKHFSHSDLLLAYLPLTHILEQFLEFTFYFLGIPIGYGTVKTLLNDSVRGCKGDLEAFRPTLLPGVPAVFEMIRKGMMKKLNDAGPAAIAVFNFAVTGKQTLPWPFSAIIDKALFARVKAVTGGRLRLAVCGGEHGRYITVDPTGGALSIETQKFMSTVMMPIMLGYGMTETCGMATITTPEFWQLGSVGVIGPSCEIKLEAQINHLKERSG
ncbi:hypothetical protein IAU60_002849 [Kwoniella sp. DSM 27419]